LTDALSAAGTHPARIPDYAELDMLAFIISSAVRGVRREVYDYNDPHDAKAAATLLSNMVNKWLAP